MCSFLLGFKIGEEYASSPIYLYALCYRFAWHECPFASERGKSKKLKWGRYGIGK